MSNRGAEVLKSFERRAARAESLAPQSPSVEAPLRFAAGLYGAQRAVAAALLEAPLSNDFDEAAGALLKPWVELLASERRQPARDRRKGTCPFCGGGAWVATRRTLPESHGAQRALVCALCAGHWEFPRIRCPACGEASPEKLPNFQDPQNAAVRIEACDTCKRYVKSIDLSLDARPIAEVDDLASLPLDLWAVEQGYQRIEPGLAGI